jgi:hypothetical protein
VKDLYILSDEGEPVLEPDWLVWGQWFESADRVVLQDAPRRGVQISTVFLGLDHSHGLSPAPVLWESMVFGGPFDLAQRRYASKLAALEGHRQLEALHTHYYIAPRKTKKALGKGGRLHHGERRRVARVWARIGASPP